MCLRLKDCPESKVRHRSDTGRENEAYVLRGELRWVSMEPMGSRPQPLSNELPAAHGAESE